MPPPRTRSRPHRRLLAAGAVAATAAALVVVAGAPTPAAAVPAPPAGWTLVWSDDFNGAGQHPAIRGQLASSTPAPATPAARPTGAPARSRLHQQHRPTSASTAPATCASPRCATAPATGPRPASRPPRTDFKAPAGGMLRIEGRIQMPNVTGAAALGYWPAFWALGAPVPAATTRTGRASASSTSWRTSTASTRVWGVLHCGRRSPGGPCNETNGIGASRACPAQLPDRLPHLPLRVGPQRQPATSCAGTSTGSSYHTVTQNQVDAADLEQHDSATRLLHPAQRRDGRRLPGRRRRRTRPRRPGPGRADAGRLRRRLHQRRRHQPADHARRRPPPPTGGGRRARTRTIQAESYNAQTGVQQPRRTTDAGGGQNIGWLANGDWARYDDVNFGSHAGPRSSVARVASGRRRRRERPGRGAPRQPSTTPPIGSFAIANTGGWQTWRTVPGNISAVTGTHTVYLTFTSGQPADFVNVNWFTFAH